MEARRVLLSDIGFTSMVPELSRSADHLCPGNLRPPTVTTYGQFLRTPDLYSPGFTVNLYSFGCLCVKNKFYVRLLLILVFHYSVPEIHVGDHNRNAKRRKPLSLALQQFISFDIASCSGQALLSARLSLVQTVVEDYALQGAFCKRFLARTERGLDNFGQWRFNRQFGG